MSAELLTVPERPPEAGPWETHIPAEHWAAISLCRQHRASLGLGDGVPFVAPHRLHSRKPALCPQECPCDGRACRDGLVGDGRMPEHEAAATGGTKRS